MFSQNTIVHQHKNNKLDAIILHILKLKNQMMLEKLDGRPHSFLLVNAS